MKYKVGDRVKIKSLDWYNANKDEYGYVDCGSREFSPKMSDLCGKIATIKDICKTNCYHLEEYDFDWTDEMIEGLVEEENEKKLSDESWKPSKEEMDVLYGLAYITNQYDEHKEKIITRLYQDLKREFFNGSSYENMFPDTEDDVRRRSTIQVLEYARSLDNYNQYGKEDIDKNIAWLEKQGKKPQGKSALEAINEKNIDNQNCVKPTNKVEPKFHVGESFNLPEGYIFKDERGNEIHALKIVLEKANTLKTQSDNMETETHRGYCTTEEETTNESKKVAWFTFWDNDFADKVELDLSNRELIQEDGKWFVVKKKGYPKTYEECSLINGAEGRISLSIIGKFTKLINARNAYWRIAGQEMRLGKPWKPDWTNQESPKYCIVYIERQIKTAERYIINTILSFPIEEMRDAFYENFKEEIEICKELL